MELIFKLVIFSLSFYAANSVITVKGFDSVSTDIKLVRYNQNTHVCCDGVLHSRPSPGSTYNEYTQCCGQKLISNNFHNQLNNKFAFGQLCCGGVVHNVTTNQMSCCGSDPINLTESVCIAGKVQMNISEENANDYYNYNLCADEKGTDVIYNQRTQVCCGARVHSKATVTTNCCGNVTYDYQTSTCCDGVIYDGSVSCCNNVSYDYRSARCCNGVMHRDVQTKYGNRRYLDCCGAELYDTETHICCRDYQINETTFQYQSKFKVEALNGERNAACCHLQLFNPKNQICTEDGPQFPSNKRLKKCCGVVFKQVKWNDLWVPVEHPTAKDLETKEGNCGEERSYFDGKKHCFLNKTYVSSPKRCEIYTTGLHISDYYDPASQTCCSGFVLNVSDDVRDKDKNACCYVGKQDYIGYSI